MSFQYIRQYYGVPAKRGGRVEYVTKQGVRLGVITSATHYVWVRFDDAKYAVPIHPTDHGLHYLLEDTP